MGLREIGGHGMAGIHSVEDRDQLRGLVNTIMNLKVV
jgi:hypothetical protein